MPLKKKILSFLLLPLILIVCPLSSFARVPNDPYYSYQTYLSSPASNSISDIWDVVDSSASSIIAVIDTGAALNHPDLRNNLWINSYEIPDNGIDDDHNGFVDDVHGYDFRNDDGTPEDAWGHGSVIAGIIGAVGNNGIGVAGVDWSAQLMILQVFGTEAEGSGYVNDFVDAIHYAVHQGAKIINASWRVKPSHHGDDVPLLKEAIQEAGDAGVLVITSAGNDSLDLDQNPVYPAAYDLDNVISVAALNSSKGTLLSNSNYGHKSVSLAVPGDGLLGTYLANGYASLTGTSAAAAYVSGVAGLILEKKPKMTPSEIKHLLIGTSHHDTSLESAVAAEGAMDARSALVTSTGISSAPQSNTTSTVSSGSPASTQDSPAPSAAGSCSLIP